MLQHVENLIYRYVGFGAYSIADWARSVGNWWVRVAGIFILRDFELYRVKLS